MTHPSIRAVAGLLLVLGTAACRPETPTPANPPPAPQTSAVAQDASALRDAINEPLDRARTVEDTVEQADQRRRAAIDAQEQ